jgi:hypothetical protein
VGLGTGADRRLCLVFLCNAIVTGGDGGFIKMSRRNNNCGVASQPTYVVLA